MGRGSSKLNSNDNSEISAFRKMSFSEKMHTIQATEKQLASAKAQETKALRLYHGAEGAVLMAPNTALRNAREAKVVEAYDKFYAASEKRAKIEDLLNRYAQIMRNKR